MTLHHEHGLASFGYLLMLSLLGTAFALVLLNVLIQKTSALFASTVTYTIPFLAVIFGLLDGESLHWIHLVGMMLILGGVYLSSMRTRSS
ncbi:MAG: EamA family transporter [Bacteroidetes bacterium]|nr:EamA family transporter [Bacteroidota bacterium]